LEINGTIKGTLVKGDYFGELALIYMALRSASIKVMTPTLFWCITRSEFRKTLEATVRKNYTTAKQNINTLPLFSFLTEQQKDSIAYSMISLKY
jgi:cGMP-dependent protein kinase